MSTNLRSLTTFRPNLSHQYGSFGAEAQTPLPPKRQGARRDGCIAKLLLVRLKCYLLIKKLSFVQDKFLSSV